MALKIIQINKPPPLNPEFEGVFVEEEEAHSAETMTGNVEPHFVIIFGIKITHLNEYFIIFHVFYVMQIVIQHKVRTNLMFIQLWLLISFFMILLTQIYII